jgi:fibronectin type 3 domain-containing protein
MILRSRIAACAALALFACAATACASWPTWSRPPWLGPTAPPDAPEPSLVYDPPAELPAPEGLGATSGQYREIPLGWDPVLMPSVAGYVVESGLSAAGPFRLRATLRDRGVLAWVDRGEPNEPLGDGAARFYRLRAFAHDGRVSSIASPIVTATSAPLPAPPTGLRAWSRQPRSIPLTWDPSEDPIVAGYTVERSPNPGGPFEVVAQLDGRQTTHLLDTGLGDLRVLHYRVSSRNPGGERGAPSDVLRAVTKPAPLPPIALRVDGHRLGAIALAWDPNVETDLLGYRLLRWHKGQPAQTVTYVGSDKTHAEDIRVAAEESYDYTLIAVDLDGLESRPSAPVHVTGLGYEWHASLSPHEVQLYWNPRPAEGFVRARITRVGALWQERTFVTESAELHDTEVTPGQTYRYRIQLERSDGQQAPASPPIVIDVPRSGDAFVEIQPPASRIPQPEGNPR